MKYRISILLIALLSPNARAADWSIRFGPGIQDGALTGATKVFGVRREAYIFHGVYSAVEGGGFVDNGGAGRKSSAVVKAQLGVSPGPDTGLYGKAFLGPCLLSATDSQLGGHGQFCTDVGVGVRDGASLMEVGYSHISSAGLALPNHGRDYLVFSTGLRF